MKRYLDMQRVVRVPLRTFCTSKQSYSYGKLRSTVPQHALMANKNLSLIKCCCPFPHRDRPILPLHCFGHPRGFPLLCCLPAKCTACLRTHTVRYEPLGPHADKRAYYLCRPWRAKAFHTRTVVHLAQNKRGDDEGCRFQRNRICQSCEEHQGKTCQIGW